MNRELKDISSKLETSLVEVFEKIHNAADLLKINFFCIGATALLILVKYYYEKKIRLRSTKDVDFGIMIDNWDSFDKLKNILIEKFGFNETEVIHRVIYNDIPIDIVPFDLNSGYNILPGSGTKLIVLGLEEAFEHSIPIKIKKDPELIINFASITGIAILKLIAWYDSFPARQKDAEDISIIINNYSDFGNMERLFNEERDIISDENTDYNLASARLLGRDIKRMSNDNTLKLLKEILDPGNLGFDHLIQNMLEGQYEESRFEEVKKVLLSLYRGLSD
jgi:predicted nucleotidyltransferase